jgi:hypothetical protein
MTTNPYIAHIQQKGYTEQEIRQSMTPAPKIVPDWYAARYPGATYESYQEALANFLNGY